MKNILFIFIVFWLAYSGTKTDTVKATKAIIVTGLDEATSGTTGSGRFDGGISVDSSIWCGKNLHVADSVHAVNAAKTNRLYYGISKGDSLQIGAAGAVIKQFWKDGDSLKVLIGADTLAWKPD